METKAVKTAISYESKLVKRNWLFRLFAIGALGYTLVFFIQWNMHHIWPDVIFASSISSGGGYFLNLFQSIIVTFIVCDIQRKRKKAETREVITVRPIGNGESFLGEFLGILIPFLVIDIIFFTILLFINILIPNSPVNLWVNLFYLLTNTLPTLIFITGLSLFVNKLIKHPFTCWFILIGFLYFSYSYLTTPLQGMLDFRASLLPNTFSSMVGYMHLADYLLQRSAFLLLGVSLLFFAALLTKRFPDIPGRKLYFIIPASLFLVFSLGLGYIYVEKFQTRLNNRNEYREAFLKYDEHPKSRVLTHDITYRIEGDRFSATSQMEIQNQKKIKMDQLLLFLNPGLKINKIESNGQNLPFQRDHQVIVIERPLAPGENTRLEIEYEGNIDEDIYQINTPDDEFFSLREWWISGENYGDRTAFVSDKFTLLIPQVMWYPTAVTPVELQASKETNFTDYTLRVKNSGDMTVLSQGEPTKEGDEVTFNNVQYLTGLTLCIGNYEKRSFTVDSVTVEFYTYPGNSFYMKYFDEWDALKKDNPNREKKLAEISSQCKSSIEDGKPNAYPFKYFKLIEAPTSSYFRATSSFSDNIQPEIVLFWERLSRMETSHPGTHSGDPDRGETVQERILSYNIPFFLNMIGIGHIFSDFNSSITSDAYQGIDLLFKQMIKLKEPRPNDGLSPKMLHRIAEKGLKGSVTEGYSEEQNFATFLKVSHLLGYFTTITTWDSLTRFMQEFNARTRFREVSFDSFIEGFEQRFGQNIKGYMDEWYTSRQVPLLSIKDLSCKTTEETQIIDFKVGNISETDGVVSIISRDHNLGGGPSIRYHRSYLIKPGEYKRIIFHEDIKCRLELTTNFSGTFPKDISLQGFQSPLSGSIPDEGITPLERIQFYPPGEIIVDNEDENFHLIDSANNRKRLADLINKEDEQDYTNLQKLKTNTWNLPLSQEFHGEHIRSAYVKKAGTGKFKAEWTANLPEAGRYEIFVHRPHVIAFSKEQYATDYPGMKNYYTLYTPEGKEEIILEAQEGDDMWLPVSRTLPADQAWVSLGTFSLPAGESRVVLDDRGVAPIPDEKFRCEHVQLVVADAVKWVKIK